MGGEREYVSKGNKHTIMSMDLCVLVWGRGKGEGVGKGLT